MVIAGLEEQGWANTCIEVQEHSCNSTPGSMYILLTIILFLFTSFAMLILHLVRPRLSIQGFLAVIATIVGLIMVLLAKSEIPSLLTLLNWTPDYLFPVSPSLLVDDVSWLLALALAALSTTIVITSITGLGVSIKAEANSTQPALLVDEEPNTAEDVLDGGTQAQLNDEHSMPNWVFWIVLLLSSSLGLVAVTASNLLTLLLAWAALDIIEIAILISQSLKSEIRERAAFIFSAKMVGTIFVLIAGLILWSSSGSLNFVAISPPVTILLIFAAAVRLGVLPPLLPLSYKIILRQDLTTVLYLIPASAAFALLIRVSSIGAQGALTPYLVILTLIIGLMSAEQWLTAQDELRGKRFWLVGSASLAILSALLNQPMACLVWSIASLLSGGLIFSFPIRHRNLIPIVILGIFNLSTLPFSPTWRGTTIYSSLLVDSAGKVIGFLFSISVLLIQSLLLAGFIRHLMRGIFPSVENHTLHIERWVWALYPVGLIITVLAHLLTGWFILPDLHGLSIFAWIIGPITLLISGGTIYLVFRYRERQTPLARMANISLWKRIFTTEWLYSLIWKMYRLISRLITLISTILEGEGGILWALVLFALIFVFLQR